MARADADVGIDLLAIKRRLLARQQAMKQEQEAILAQNAADFASKAVDESGEAFSRRVRESFLEDLRAFEVFNDRRASFADKDSIPWSVRTHKMKEVLSGGLGVLGEDESRVCSLAEGKLPSGWDISFDDLPVLGTKEWDPASSFPMPSKDFYWGTSNVSFLSAALLEISFTINGTSIANIPLSSAITHVTALPECLELEGSRFSWSGEVSSGRSLHGIGYVHSGYAFGGFRGEKAIYPDGKLHGPEDCSSWVSKETKCSSQYSTYDQLMAMRVISKDGVVPEEWLKSASATSMLERYASPDKPMPGDVHVVRVFNGSDNIKISMGRGGHTTIVDRVDVDSGDVRTLGFNRDMPGFEGFGYQTFPIDKEERGGKIRDTFFLRVKP